MSDSDSPIQKADPATPDYSDAAADAADAMAAALDALASAKASNVTNDDEIDAAAHAAFAVAMGEASTLAYAAVHRVADTDAENADADTADAGTTDAENADTRTTDAAVATATTTNAIADADAAHALADAANAVAAAAHAAARSADSAAYTANEAAYIANAAIEDAAVGVVKDPVLHAAEFAHAYKSAAAEERMIRNMAADAADAADEADEDDQWVGVSADEQYPFVSVCTPTFNRRPFIAAMLQCFRNQTYPADRMEWIIVDDGTDKVDDLIDQARAADLSQIRYFSLPAKLALGAKRNFVHDRARGSILVYMDDDDYYPPERVEHAVQMLQRSAPDVLCAGASELYVFFNHVQQMVQFGPYGPNHATAATLAFRRELLETARYSDDAEVAEEVSFLHDRATGQPVRMVQLEPTKTLLVFAHTQNTIDKRQLLETQSAQYMRTSTKTVAEFIRAPDAAGVAALTAFYTQQMDALLQDYAPGKRSMKPDALAQIHEMEEARRAQLLQLQQQPSLVLKEGDSTRTLTMPDIVQLLQTQDSVITDLRAQLHQAKTQSPVQIKCGDSTRYLSAAEIVQTLQQQQAQTQQQQSQIQQQQTQIQQQQSQLNQQHSQMLDKNVLMLRLQTELAEMQTEMYQWKNAAAIHA